MTDFCHLHLHGHQSILDGYSITKDIPAVAKQLGQEAVCLTDHGSLAGSLDFWKAGKEQGIKTIQGCELYITPDMSLKDKDSPTWHMIALAMNQQGWQSLLELSKIAWTQGFYRKPRLGFKELELHNEGLIFTSACMGGHIPRTIEVQGMDAAKSVCDMYRNMLGDRFYIELQPGNSAELNTRLAELAAGTKIRTVVAVDAHHDYAENLAIQELLLTIQQISSFKASDEAYAKAHIAEARKANSLLEKLNILWPNRGLRFYSYELFIMSRQQVQDRMDKQGFDGKELCDTSLEIAERCKQIEFKAGNYLPKPKVEDSDEHLRKLCNDGLRKILPTIKGPTQPYVDRLAYELELIKAQGFSDYFLLVYDIYNAARARNIYYGYGRGSVTGCLTAYCLGIIAVDPIKYKTLFARFMDEERMDPPDIDCDWEHTRRDELKDWSKDEYGNVLGISTYTEYHGKSVVRAICRALCISIAEQNSVCKQFNSLDEYFIAPGTLEFRNRYPEVGPAALKLEGHITASGAHAAGIVISDRPMEQIIPIESRTDPQNKKQRIAVSAYDMYGTAESGLLKLDFLGLMNLTVVHECIDMIKERHGIDIDYLAIEPDDEQVFYELNKGNSLGVFQMESSAYRKLLMEMGVDNFNDMVASNALVRPGAYQTVVKDYIRRKKGLAEVQYPHEVVKEILQDTFGLVVYQEQLMQVAMALGGFSAGEANKLRGIIGKKRDVAEFKPYYDKWIQGATNYVSTAEAKKLWSDFEKHAGYSFSLNHSVGYSLLSYLTCWLKLKYPIEYMFGLLRSEKKDTMRMSYLLEAVRLGIQVLPPDINRSDMGMIIEDDALRFGLTDIKGVGLEAAKDIIHNRPKLGYESYEQFEAQTTTRKVNAKVKTALEMVGAFGDLCGGDSNNDHSSNYMEYLSFPISLTSIATMGLQAVPLEEYEEGGEFVLVAAVVKAIKRTATYVRIELEDMTGNCTVFGTMTNDLSTGELILALIGDKTMCVYARIEGLKERMANGSANEQELYLADKKALFGKYEKLVASGIDGLDGLKSLVVPLQVREFMTKAGKPMAQCVIADRQGRINKMVVFPTQYKQYKNKLSSFQPICVQLQLTQDGKSFCPDQLETADAVMKLKGYSA